MGLRSIDYPRIIFCIDSRQLIITGRKVLNNECQQPLNHFCEALLMHNANFWHNAISAFGGGRYLWAPGGYILRRELINNLRFF